MKKQSCLIPHEKIFRTILFLRGQKIMLDADLAELYGVSTKRLNEQVRRNASRFPIDFMSRLTVEEKKEVVANCDHLKQLKFSPSLPNAFTEYGAIMLATVLNTRLAVRMSLQVVRAFVRLREILATHKSLARKIEEMEMQYDANFRVLFNAVRRLSHPPVRKKQMIGFHL
ncbi:MAG: ORF6N domain-containing protein [Candidatus Omnitrophota bacterium]